MLVGTVLLLMASLPLPLLSGSGWNGADGTSSSSGPACGMDSGLELAACFWASSKLIAEAKPIDCFTPEDRRRRRIVPRAATATERATYSPYQVWESGKIPYEECLVP